MGAIRAITYTADESYTFAGDDNFGSIHLDDWGWTFWGWSTPLVSVNGYVDFTDRPYDYSVQGSFDPSYVYSATQELMYSSFAWDPSPVRICLWGYDLYLNDSGWVTHGPTVIDGKQAYACTWTNLKPYYWSDDGSYDGARGADFQLIMYEDDTFELNYDRVTITQIYGWQNDLGDGPAMYSVGYKAEYRMVTKADYDNALNDADHDFCDRFDDSEYIELLTEPITVDHTNFTFAEYDAYSFVHPLLDGNAKALSEKTNCDVPGRWLSTISLNALPHISVDITLEATLSTDIWAVDGSVDVGVDLAGAMAQPIFGTLEVDVDAQGYLAWLGSANLESTLTMDVFVPTASHATTQPSVVYSNYYGLGHLWETKRTNIDNAGVEGVAPTTTYTYDFGRLDASSWHFMLGSSQPGPTAQTWVSVNTVIDNPAYEQSAWAGRDITLSVWVYIPDWTGASRVQLQVVESNDGYGPWVYVVPEVYAYGSTALANGTWQQLTVTCPGVNTTTWPPADIRLMGLDQDTLIVEFYVDDATWEWGGTWTDPLMLDAFPTTSAWRSSLHRWATRYPLSIEGGVEQDYQPLQIAPIAHSGSYAWMHHVHPDQVRQLGQTEAGPSLQFFTMNLIKNNDGYLHVEVWVYVPDGQSAVRLGMAPYIYRYDPPPYFFISWPMVREVRTTTTGQWELLELDINPGQGEWSMGTWPGGWGNYPAQVYLMQDDQYTKAGEFYWDDVAFGVIPADLEGVPFELLVYSADIVNARVLADIGMEATAYDPTVQVAGDIDMDVSLVGNAFMPTFHDVEGTLSVDIGLSATTTWGEGVAPVQGSMTCDVGVSGPVQVMIDTWRQDATTGFDENWGWNSYGTYVWLGNAWANPPGPTTSRVTTPKRDGSYSRKYVWAAITNGTQSWIEPWSAARAFYHAGSDLTLHVWVYVAAGSPALTLQGYWATLMYPESKTAIGTSATTTLTDTWQLLEATIGWEDWRDHLLDDRINFALLHGSAAATYYVEGSWLTSPGSIESNEYRMGIEIPTYPVGQYNWYEPSFSDVLWTPYEKWATYVYSNLTRQRGSIQSSPHVRSGSQSMWLYHGGPLTNAVRATSAELWNVMGANYYGNYSVPEATTTRFDIDVWVWVDEDSSPVEMSWQYSSYKPAVSPETGARYFRHSGSRTVRSTTTGQWEKLTLTLYWPHYMAYRPFSSSGYSVGTGHITISFVDQQIVNQCFIDDVSVRATHVDKNTPAELLVSARQTDTSVYMTANVTGGWVGTDLPIGLSGTLVDKTRYAAGSIDVVIDAYQWVPAPAYVEGLSTAGELVSVKGIRDETMWDIGSSWQSYMPGFEGSGNSDHGDVDDWWYNYWGYQNGVYDWDEYHTLFHYGPVHSGTRSMKAVFLEGAGTIKLYAELFVRYHRSCENRFTVWVWNEPGNPPLELRANTKWSASSYTLPVLAYRTLSTTHGQWEKLELIVPPFTTTDVHNSRGPCIDWEIGFTERVARGTFYVDDYAVFYEQTSTLSIQYASSV